MGGIKVVVEKVVDWEVRLEVSHGVLRVAWCANWVV